MNRPTEAASTDSPASPALTSPERSANRDNPYIGTSHGQTLVEARLAHGERRAGPTHARYYVLLWLCLAATIAYVSRNSLAVAEKTIRLDLGLTERQMGWAMSAFFWSYAIAQLPTGWLADRIGSRKALVLYSLGWSLATAMAALAVWGQSVVFELPGLRLVFGLPLVTLCVARFLNGLSQAGLFPGSTNTISKWFSKDERAFPSGALASFMSLGGAAGGAIAGYLLGPVGMRWEWLFVVFSVPGVAWALGYYLWFRDEPADHRGVSEEELRLIQGRTPPVSVEQIASEASEPPPGALLASAPLASPREKTPWLALVSSPAMFWICAQQFFRAAAYMFFASWFPTYLQETRDVSLEKSAYLTALPLMAVVVGGLFGGKLSDVVLLRTGSRRWGRQVVAAASMALCGGLIFVAYFIADPLLAVLVISLGTLFFAIGGPPSYAITIDMGGRHVATVFSTMNMAGNVGAAMFPLMVTELRAQTSWESVLLLFGGMFIASAFCWMMLKPEGSVFDQSLLGRE